MNFTGKVEPCVILLANTFSDKPVIQICTENFDKSVEKKNQL